MLDVTLSSRVEGFAHQWWAEPRNRNLLKAMNAAVREIRRLKLSNIFCVAIALVLVVTGYSDFDVAHTVAHASPELVASSRLLSYLGLSGYMLVISTIVGVAAAFVYRTTPNRRFAVRARRWTQCAILFFVSVAASGIVCQAVKHLVGRSRPKMLDQLGAFYFEGPTFRASIDSFPSGHTTVVFAAAVVLSLVRPAWTGIFVALALLIGIARIFAGAHYPSDIVAGATVGSLIAFRLARSFLDRGLICETCVKLPRIGSRRARAAAPRHSYLE